MNFPRFADETKLESTKRESKPFASNDALRRELDRLMEFYQQGDQKAARTLITRVSPMLFSFFLRLPGNQNHASDLLQETWMRVHKIRHTYRSGQPVLPWLYAIARNIRTDAYRKRIREASNEQAMEFLPEPNAPAPVSTDLPSRIAALISTLPESQREVITMLKEGDMSLEEVARATGSTVGSVKQKAHRAYQKLRQTMRQASSHEDACG